MLAQKICWIILASELSNFSLDMFKSLDKNDWIWVYSLNMNMTFIIDLHCQLIMAIKKEIDKIINYVSLCLSAREPLPTWDKQIQSLCFQVNNLLEKIRQAAPEWAAQAMETQMTQ